jgi:hypothetical protein
MTTAANSDRIIKVARSADGTGSIIVPEPDLYLLHNEQPEPFVRSCSPVLSCYFDPNLESP